MKISRQRMISLSLVMSLVVASINFTGVQSKADETSVNQSLNNLEKTVPEISDLQIKDYSQYTGKYLIYFNQQQASKEYNVYIDSMEKVVKKIKSSGEYLSTDELTEFEAGTHTMYVTCIGDNKAESEPVSSEFKLTEIQGDYNDIPQVYIYSSEDITKTYHDRADVVISIVDKDGGSSKDIIDSGSNIKIRGNTTASAAKKHWNFKLGSKEKVLGMDKGKKWCLLSNP